MSMNTKDSLLTQSREDYETWAVKANTWLHRVIVFNTLLLLCVPIEIDILGHSCYVKKLRNLLKTAFASFTRQKFQARVADVSTFFWTQTDRKTLLWLDVGVDNVPVATRNLCWFSVLVTAAEGHPLENRRWIRNKTLFWRTIYQARVEGPKHHQHEDVLRFVQQAPFCGLCNRLLMISIGQLIRMSLMTSLLCWRTRLLVLTEFPSVSRGFAGGFGSKFLLRA